MWCFPSTTPRPLWIPGGGGGGALPQDMPQQPVLIKSVGITMTISTLNKRFLSYILSYDQLTRKGGGVTQDVGSGTIGVKNVGSGTIWVKKCGKWDYHFNVGLAIFV